MSQRKSLKRKPEKREQGLLCRIQKECGACRYINTPLETGLTEKYQQALQILDKDGHLQDARIMEPERSPALLHYRTHAKLAVRARPGDSDGGLAIGLYKPGTHEVVDLENCPLHRRSINDLLRDLKTALPDSGLLPYDEASHQGDLRYIAVRASHLTEELMLTLVLTSADKAASVRQLGLTLRDSHPSLKSVFININADVTNVIFGSKNRRILGADQLREGLCDFQFGIGPTSFFQVNPAMADLIYRRIEQLAGDGRGQPAWDLYCGTGQISLLLARRGYRTLGIETNAAAITNARENRRRNTDALSTEPEFLTGRVEEFAPEDFPDWATSPGLIVINPSRKGLAEPVRTMLAGMLQKHRGNLRLIYMSCAVESLSRDLTDLCAGGARIRQIEAFDMFPHTDKLEWLATVS